LKDGGRRVTCVDERDLVKKHGLVGEGRGHGEKGARSPTEHHVIIDSKSEKIL